VSEKVSIRLPGHLACLVRPDAQPDAKRKALEGGVAATSTERATLLFFLCHDKDPGIKTAAIAAMKALSREVVEEVTGSSTAHPRLVELLQKLHPDLTPPLLEPEVAAASEENPEDAGTDSPSEEEKPAEEDKPAEEEEEEFKSKYQLAQTMGVGEKIKMALTGDKEWRSILIKDSNKLVNGAVVKNPRITEPEILTISKSVIQNDEILRVICHNKEWVKNYEIRKALVLNNKTPLPVALRFMGFLTEKDLATIAKSKNVSSVLANNARRTLATKKKN
jgi:hypothetical protein